MSNANTSLADTWKYSKLQQNEEFIIVQSIFNINRFINNLSSLHHWWLAVLLTFASINSHAALEGTVIPHPGKYELVYFGIQPTDPPVFTIKAHYKYFHIFANVLFPSTVAVIPSIQSVFLLEHSKIYPNEEVLDIGTGIGIQAIFAAEVARRVVATDISPDATRNALFNVKNHQVEDKVEVRLGDLFAPIKPNEVFDVILFNIDYPYDEKTQGLWSVHQRFFDNVSHYLKPSGRIYYQAGLIENIPKIQKMVRNNKLRIMKMDMVSAIAVSQSQHREPIVFLIQRDPMLGLSD